MLIDGKEWRLVPTVEIFRIIETLERDGDEWGAAAELRAMLATAPQPDMPKAQEAVAWISTVMCVGSEYGKERYGKLPIQSLMPGYYKHTPLYLAPAAAQQDDAPTAAELSALLPSVYYMDPPDGGDVPLIEQLRRMAADAARYRRLRENWIDCDELGLHGRTVVIDDVIDAAMSNEKELGQQSDERDAQFDLWQDDMVVASACGPRSKALAEIQHYAAIYSQDGPVWIEEVIRIPLDGARVAEALAAAQQSIPDNPPPGTKGNFWDGFADAVKIRAAMSKEAGDE